MRVKGAYATDIGIKREVNQDAITLRAIEQNGEWFVLGAVCDGIGGLEYGEVSSNLVINGVNQWFDGICSWIDIAIADQEAIYQRLVAAANDWNQDVRKFCLNNDVKSGTTMSLILIIRDYFYIVQVGDSRVYRNHNYLEQLTQDQVTVKEVNGKPKNFLNNFIGKSDELIFSSLQGKIESGDVFLFCSDGFYHCFSEWDMHTIMQQYQNHMGIPDICIQEIQTMEQRQETDNISIGLIFTEES